MSSKGYELVQLAKSLVVDANGTITDLDIDTTNIEELVNIDLSIAPEVLEIQVAAPAAGQDTAWLWTWEQSTLPYARRTITNSPEVQVPLYKQGTYTLNNYAAYDLFGSMTQTHTLYIKWIDGAGTDNLVSWATSTGPVSDSHPDINSGNATDVQRININVPATITLPTLTPPNVSYTVTNNGAGAYTFSGAAFGDNPNIGPLYRGGTYTFNVSATGHPFYFTTDNGTNFASGTYFGEYTDGVTGSRTDSGTVTIVVPSDAPDTLYYQCGNHSPMRGAITVKNLAVETNINGNYVIYAQHTQEGHKTPIELRPIPSLVNQMCLVYDSSTGKFVPQDLATYVENTPSFENKIREVAGTAELVVEDGSAVIAKVNVYDDSTYLPLTGNNPGDQAFATDTDILYIWDGSAWQQAGAANTDDLAEGSTNLFYTNERVDDRVAALLVGGNNITATYDDVAGTLTIDGQPGYTDSDVGTYLSANGYDTATNIVASITDSAPTTLDTLNELAAALGDDPNFATTVSTQIGTKLNSADFDSTFDTRFATTIASDVTFGGAVNAATLSGDGSAITNLTFPATTNRYSYTATANQTSFTATYTTGAVDVFLNGIKLVRTDDYNDTSETAIVLTSGVAAGETVEIIAYENFTVGDAVSASAGGTFSGPVIVDATATIGSTLTLRQDGTNDEIKSTGNVLYVKAPEYSFQNTSGTEYLSIDTAGKLYLGTSDSSDHKVNIRSDQDTGIVVNVVNALSGGGTSTMLNLTNNTDTDIQFVINEVGAATKYASIGPSVSGRALALGAPGDAANVGIGTFAPQRRLHIHDGGSTGLKITNDQSGAGANDGFDIYVRDDNQDAELVQRENSRIKLYTNNNPRVTIDASGNVGIGNEAPSIKLYVDIPSSEAGDNGIGVNRGFVSFRSVTGTDHNEKIQGESNAMGIYGYNDNDGFLFYGNNASGGATPDYRPAYHFGGYNNANSESYGRGWADGDAIFTMTRMDGSKTTAGAAPAQGLSTSSYRHSIVKTTSKTEFYDSQGQHYFDGHITAGQSVRGESTSDAGFHYRSGSGGNGYRSFVHHDGQTIFRDTGDYNHKMWYYDGVNISTNQSHGHFRVYGDNNTSRDNNTGGNTIRFSVDTPNGNIGVTEGGSQIYSGSDARLKTNVVDLDNQLEKIKQLRPVSFDWKYTAEEEYIYGFIAQEVQAVDPTVTYDMGTTHYRVDKQYGEDLEPDGTIENTLAIYERQLIPMMVKAMQEMSDKIDSLQTRLDEAGL